MNKQIFRSVLGGLALWMAAPAWAGPIPEMQESTAGLLSFDLPAEQSGRFEVSFDATPQADRIDGFTGLSAADPRIANDVAAMVRFNDEGTIDVRNGGAFRADQALGYAAKTVYRMRMIVDVPRKTYSVFVTPAGQPEVLLARDYAFRTQQAGVATLRKIVIAGFRSRNGLFLGPHRVSGVALKSTPSQ